MSQKTQNTYHPRKKPDQRKHERFEVQVSACATLTGDIIKTGQVVDISRGGLAFNYYFLEKKMDDLPEASLSLMSNGFYLMNLPYKVVADFKIGDQSEMRCNIQFGKLSESQIIQIDYFICNYTDSLKPDRRLTADPLR